jgi:hypothetical protein
MERVKLLTAVLAASLLCVPPAEAGLEMARTGTRAACVCASSAASCRRGRDWKQRGEERESEREGREGKGRGGGRERDMERERGWEFFSSFVGFDFWAYCIKACAGGSVFGNIELKRAQRARFLGILT